jgi:hypothetical protein
MDSDFDFLLIQQHGVFTRVQARTDGITMSAIRAQLDAHRWRRHGAGVLVAHNGELDTEAITCAALLACGSGALLSHDSAAFAQGLLDEPPSRVHVTVPERRKVAPRASVVVHRRRGQLRTAAGRRPPQVSVEDTIIDRSDAASTPDRVIALVAAAMSKRLTTPGLLAAALARRPRARWRELLQNMVADSDGVESVLEWRYRRDVERRHHLPIGARQQIAVGSGVRERRDVVYEEWGLVVELDGRLGQVGEVLQRLGWTGTLTSCPTCSAGR